MSNCIRERVPGGTYFFTTRLADPTSTLLIDEVDRLRAATRRTMDRYPFTIDAIAILPDAIHTIWTLPPDDGDYAVRWSMLKSLFSRGLPTPPDRNRTQVRRGEKGIWQRRFREHRITDANDLAAHRAFIHASPVHAGLCAHPAAWQHSSYHRDRRLDLAHAPSRPRIGHGATPSIQKAFSP